MIVPQPKEAFLTMSEILTGGPMTGVSLSDLRPLTAPWTRRWGRMLPPLSPAALQLCVEMAAVTYTLELEPWLRAGWREIALDVDGTLTQGIGEEDDTPLDGLKRTLDGVRRRILQARINPRDAAEAMVGSIGQRRAIDSAKTLVMTHPLPEQEGGKKYLVAVSFMGTTPRLYDWLGNLRMSDEAGFHQGFLQVCRSFEAQAEELCFPHTARELGLEKLTFGDICRACAREDSPFQLLLVGHSQGGAVAQIWAWDQLKAGFMRRNMAGYCFASPLVAMPGAVERPELVPVYHVLNSDDVVPKMGSALRLGIDLTYPADEGLRRASYNWPRDERHVANRMLLRPLTGLIHDTASCFEVGCGLLLSLQGLELSEALPALRAIRPDWPALNELSERASMPSDRLIQFILRRAMAAHQSCLGRPLDMERAAQISAIFRKVEDGIGVPAIASAFLEMALPPHRVLPHEGYAYAAYPYITLFGTDRLMPSVWIGGDRERCVMIDRHAAQSRTPHSRGALDRKHREVRHG